MSSWFPKTISLALVAAACAVPAAASASSVTYIDGGNVRVASPDGAINRAVSTDGSTQNSYHLPTAADDGEITAIQGGNTSSKMLTVFPAAGGNKIVNVMPWQVTGWTNIGPNGASVNPTGGQIAYTYLKNHGPYSGYPNGGFQSRLAIVTRRAPGLPTNPMVDQAQSWEEPTWIDNKLVVSIGGELYHEKQPLTFERFLHFPATQQGKLNITRGIVSRDKRRYLLQVRDWNNVEGLYLAINDGTFPGGNVSQACWIPVNGELDDHWGLSPDGTQVTWADNGGVQVGTYSPERQASSLCTGNRVTLSATGSEPSFGMATLTNPTPPPPPVVEEPKPTTPAPPTIPTPSTTKPVLKSSTTTTRTAPGGVPAATTTGSADLELAAPVAVKTAASLSGGLKVAASAPKPGTLTAKLTDKGKTLGSAKLKVTKAGRYTLKLKLTKAGKKAVKKLKGKKVTLTVAFAPKGGGAKLSSTAKVTLK